jgi:hypothetical protein
LPRSQVALRTNQLGVFYFDDKVPLAAVLDEGGAIEGAAFLSTWQTINPPTTQHLPKSIADVDATKAKLAAANYFVLAHRPVRPLERACWPQDGWPPFRHHAGSGVCSAVTAACFCPRCMEHCNHAPGTTHVCVCYSMGNTMDFRYCATLQG